MTRRPGLTGTFFAAEGYVLYVGPLVATNRELWMRPMLERLIPRESSPASAQRLVAEIVFSMSTNMACDDRAGLGRRGRRMGPRRGEGCGEREPQQMRDLGKMGDDPEK
jgi:hypothetical protein